VVLAAFYDDHKPDFLTVEYKIGLLITSQIIPDKVITGKTTNLFQSSWRGSPVEQQTVSRKRKSVTVHYIKNIKG
jgi:hypothetical protein